LREAKGRSDALTSSFEKSNFYQIEEKKRTDPSNKRAILKYNMTACWCIDPPQIPKHSVKAHEQTRQSLAIYD
jgi:hypothetical protein